MDLKDLETIARRELAKNGLRGWSFGLSKAKRRLGVCKYEAKRIEIAEYYARNSPEATVLDTLLHEIAHAIAGPAAQHGPKWKAVAVRLGATPKSCESSGQAVVEPGDWRATCPACEKTIYLLDRSGERFCRGSWRGPPRRAAIRAVSVGSVRRMGALDNRPLGIEYSIVD